MITKNKFTMRKILIPILLLVLPIITMSQNESKWNFQLSGGPVIFYGDVMNDYTLYPDLNTSKAWNYGGALNLGYSLNRYLGLRAQMKYGQIGGINSQGIYFEGDLLDASLQAKLNFNEIIGNQNPYRTLNLYGLAGIGASNWETTLYNAGGSRHNNNDDDGILNMTPEGFVTGGLGLSYRINDHFDLNLEGVLHVTDSDKLDDYAGSGSSENDMYSYTSLGLSYKFGPSTTRSPSRTMDREKIPQEETKQQKEEPKEEKPEPFEVTLDSDMPSAIDAGESFGVTIRINKGNLDGAATLRQVLPRGVNVQPLSLAGGEYNFMNQVFTVNWQNLPVRQPTIKIIYRVDSENIEGGTYPINGIFTYTQNNKSKQLNFKDTLEVNEKEEEKKQVKEQKPTDKEQGVVFRVQIRAKYQKKISKENLVNKFNLQETIYEDYHDGYYIYTVGNFSSYEGARSKRDKLINQHGVKDAFVTAFKDGERVDKLKDLERFK